MKLTMIQNFKKIRRDGKVIEESMKAKDMIALGWSPDKVLAVQWDDESRPVCIRSNFGILAKIISGRESIAVIEECDKTGQHSTLSIINTDGSLRLRLPNIQVIRNKDEIGEFCWFEPQRVNSPNVFGVVFSLTSDNSMFQLDIDAGNGAIVGVYPMQ